MNYKGLLRLIELGDAKKFIAAAKESDDSVITMRDGKFNRSLLDHTAIHNQKRITKFLCKNYGDIIMPPENGSSALHYAARYGSVDSLNELLGYANQSIIDHQDHKQKTALDLAIQYGHEACIRALINSGATLPADLEQLNAVINLTGYIVYREAGGLYKLLTSDEIDLLEASDKISDLTLQESADFARKPFSIKIKSNESVLLKLVDKYLYLCNRVYKEARERRYGTTDIIKEKFNLSKNNRQSLLNIIRLIVAATSGHNIDHKTLVNVASANQNLTKYAEIKRQEKQRYYGDDLSDDSDSDDEKAYLDSITGSSVFLDEKSREYRKNSLKQNQEFWLKTRMDTPRRAGLKQKVTTASNNIKQGYKQSSQLDALTDVVTGTLNKELTKRGEITYENDDQQHGALELIDKINSCAPENRLQLLEKSKPIFILGTRGINYMLDRWNADARRYHRKMDECQQPQYCEAVLKTLPYDYYTDLSLEQDYHLHRTEASALHNEALNLHGFFQKLAKAGLCINASANQNGSYLFNSVDDCLQDHFSNGVDAHLNNFAELREKYPDYWGMYLKNSFNPNIAIGSRPYHALKYTYGLKNYYPRSMFPRYWNDGTIEYPHVGKVYLSLHPLQEIISPEGPNNISMLERKSRVAIGDQISPEKELSFIGLMAEDRVFHQYVAKFPSFKGKWKNIYQFKYGLDKEVYAAFAHLISVTLPETPERDRIINLLSEWLCSYYEVLLIDIAQKEAVCRGGILAYVNREGELTLEPDNGRIFTGGAANLNLRNEVHIMRDLRSELTQHLKKYPKDSNTVPGFDLVQYKNVITTLESLLHNKAFLEKIAAKVQLSETEDSQVYLKKTTPEKIKRSKAKLVVHDLINDLKI